MGFRDGIGGKWLVTQNIDGDEVVNSCHTIEDARQRAEDLVRQSPNLTATIYKAVEKAEAEHSPIKIKTLT